MSYVITPIKKSKSFSKYLYSSIDESNDFYVFDIKLSNDKKKFKKIKKIKNSKSDMLLDLYDNISTKYTKINLEIAATNNIDDIHSVSIELNSNKSTIYKDDYIYLEISSECDIIKCFYNLETF